MSRIYRILAAVLGVLILAGCGGVAKPEKGDFSLELPEGYAIAEETVLECAIVREADGETVGGIQVTGLKLRDLKDKETKHIMRYVQEEIYGTNNVEYFAGNWGTKTPIVSINLTAHLPEGNRDGYHLFFPRASAVYHLWIDLGKVDFDEAQRFIPCTGVE